MTEIADIIGLDIDCGIKKIDLHKENITKINGLERFKDLIFIELSHNKIENIEGLNSLTKLKSLSLLMNKVKEIRGLEDLRDLEKLRLSNNQITEISGLDNLVNLKELYLDHNQITRIQGLDTLVNLRRLDLRYNKITQISGLSALSRNMEENDKKCLIRLSNNNLRNLQGIEKINHSTIRLNPGYNPYKYIPIDALKPRDYMHFDILYDPEQQEWVYTYTGQERRDEYSINTTTGNMNNLNGRDFLNILSINCSETGALEFCREMDVRMNAYDPEDFWIALKSGRKVP